MAERLKTNNNGLERSQLAQKAAKSRNGHSHSQKTGISPAVQPKKARLILSDKATPIPEIDEATLPPGWESSPLRFDRNLTGVARLQAKFEANAARRAALLEIIGDPIEALTHLLDEVPEEIKQQAFEKDENGEFYLKKFPY